MFFNTLDLLVLQEIKEMTENNLELFEKNRKIGENDFYICSLIRNDSITEFITYVNQTNFSLNNKISPSIFETNLFLIDKKPSLIEYSAFFGSIQIFKFLTLNNVKLTESLWIYAIHGQNPEIFHFLEESKIIKYYNKCICESIKCHHIEFTDYIKDNLIISEEDENELYDFSKIDEIDEIDKIDIRSKDEYPISDDALKYFNYYYLQPEDLIFNSNLYYLCEYDYCNLVSLLIKDPNTNVNYKRI